MGSFKYIKRAKYGKVNTPLNELLDNVEWGECKLCTLFEVVGTKSLDSNAIDFTATGINFVGRTFEDNGIQGKINKFLSEFYAKAGLKLVDFKLEFGKDSNGNIILIDELSPDNFRLWDAKTNEKMDKDRFRQGLGGLIEAYEEVLKRIQK